MDHICILKPFELIIILRYGDRIMTSKDVHEVKNPP